MTKIIATIKSFTNLLALKPATKSEIADAERQLQLHFAEDYKAYLMEFGAILADGIELTGIAKSEHRNVVTVTKKERKLNSKVPPTLYVIENLGIDGIIIGQNCTGDIYQTTPNSEPMNISESLEAYLIERFIK